MTHLTLQDPIITEAIERACEAFCKPVKAVHSPWQHVSEEQPFWFDKTNKKEIRQSMREAIAAFFAAKEKAPVITTEAP